MFLLWAGLTPLTANFWGREGLFPTISKAV